MLRPDVEMQHVKVTSSRAARRYGELDEAVPPTESPDVSCCFGIPDIDCTLRGAWSFVQFGWADRAVRTGRTNGSLTENELPKLWPCDEPLRLATSFARHRKLVASSGGTFSLLFRITFGAQARTCILCFAFASLVKVSEILIPMVFQSLLESLGSNGADGATGNLLAHVLAMSAMQWLKVVGIEHWWWTGWRISCNARAILMMEVFECGVSGKTRASDGKLINMLSGDADKIGDRPFAFQVFEFFFIMIQLPIIIARLYALVGVASIWCIVLVLLLTVAGTINGKLLRSATDRITVIRDERSRLLQGLIKGVRLVRLHACESAWRMRIERTRKREVDQIVIFRSTNIAFTTVVRLLSLAVPLSVFSWYTLAQGELLDAATAFTALYWIGMLRGAVNVVPSFIMTIGQLIPGLRRIARAIQITHAHAADTLTASSSSSSSSSTSSSPKIDTAEGMVSTGGPLALSPGSAVELSCARLVTAAIPESADDDNDNDDAVRAAGGKKPAADEKHAAAGAATVVAVPAARVPASQESGKVIFEHASLAVRTGELVVVIGASGAGKSTLLAALASARAIAGGQRASSSSRSFVPQKPFLMSRTLAENVVFELPFEQRAYNRAVSRALLGPDIAALPKGDDTYVGEAGVQLSGGQRSRVALARALYSEARLLLLDDVLSAVDSATGEALWQVLGEERAVGKTIVLVTHQLQLLSRPEVDRVVFVRVRAAAPSPLLALSKLFPGSNQSQHALPCVSGFLTLMSYSCPCLSYASLLLRSSIAGRCS